MSNDDAGTVTGSLISYWGVPTEIKPRNLPGVSKFATVEFAPRKDRLSWRYATNGMSQHLQLDEQGRPSVRTELYACTSRRAPWVHDLLSAIATYPLDYETTLFAGNTIDVGQPIDRMHSPFVGVMLLSPPPTEPTIIETPEGDMPMIRIYWVLGLLSRELDAAREGRHNVLYENITRFGDGLLDKDRSPLA